MGARPAQGPASLAEASEAPLWPTVVGELGGQGVDDGRLHGPEQLVDGELGSCRIARMGRLELLADVEAGAEGEAHRLDGRQPGTELFGGDRVVLGCGHEQVERLVVVGAQGGVDQLAVGALVGCRLVVLADVGGWEDPGGRGPVVLEQAGYLGGHGRQHRLYPRVDADVVAAVAPA